MTDTPTKISVAALTLLVKASQRGDRFAPVPENLPPAARHALCKHPLRAGLLEEVPAPLNALGIVWRRDELDMPIAVRVTDAGLRALGKIPPADEPTIPSPRPGIAPSEASDVGAAVDSTPAARMSLLGDKPASLREAASAVLSAWDSRSVDEANVAATMEASITHLRVLISDHTTTRHAMLPRALRQGTKRELVLALLRRPEGASGPAIVEATGWAPHTVRGFLAGLKKSGCPVETLPKGRTVNSEDGTNRSFSVYRIADRG